MDPSFDNPLALDYALALNQNASKAPAMTEAEKEELLNREKDHANEDLSTHNKPLSLLP